MIGKMLKMISLVTTIVAVATGCATFGTGQAGDAGTIVSLINQGDVEQLTRIAVLPFVFEGEVLYKASDVEAVWRNLSINGFRIERPKFGDTVSIDVDTFQIFADTYEMEVFFGKYVPAGARLAAIASGGQEYWLLLGKASGGSPEFLGITGF